MSTEYALIESNDRFRVIFGDWQTPPELAQRICRLAHQFINPQLIVEPNCGLGAFIYAAMNEFPSAVKIWGADINERYVQQIQMSNRVIVEPSDFFQGRWKKIIQDSVGPVLVIGNPPWVTNSELMRQESSNLPTKRNQCKLNGIEAITGKSNFDISQWMLQEEIQALQGRDAVLAMLCKSSCARKTVLYAWNNQYKFSMAEIRLIDAKKYFNVSVDACLFLMRFTSDSGSKNVSCTVYSSLESNSGVQSLGIRHGALVNDTSFIDAHPELMVQGEPDYCWRSGIKHDCAKIMELKRQKGNLFSNGFSEIVELESGCLYPLLKSSDLANGRIERISRYMLVPQTCVGQDTSYIKKEYPHTWDYLQKNLALFEKRKSTIYRAKPIFSVFGIGSYTFSKWKVAISGLYKKLAFQLVPPFANKPVVFDDTCYFLPLNNERQAQFVLNILKSELCDELLNALIFWDAKRPITRDILNRVNIYGLAIALNRKTEYEELFLNSEMYQQLTLF